MALTESDYSQQLKALLPKGPIWQSVTGSVLDSILTAFSKEFARVDARALDIVDENDPRTAMETLQTWFDDWGIPSACLAAISDPTNEQMRSELISKITSSRSLTPAYFEDVAAAAGYDADVVTYEVYTVADTVDKQMFGNEWNTAFSMAIRVNDDGGMTVFDTTWTCDQPLGAWGDAFLECLIKNLVPAHVIVIFEYGEVQSKVDSAEGCANNLNNVRFLKIRGCEK
jgi:uncharacterized protein YmfQ (DUF2313 family)